MWLICLYVRGWSEVYIGVVYLFIRYLVVGRKCFSGVIFGEVECDLF